MNVFGPVALLFVPLALSACASFDTGEDQPGSVSKADAYIGNVRPGSEDDARINHGIGATPTY